MKKFFVRRKKPTTKPEVEDAPTPNVPPQPDYGTLVQRIISGDRSAESELVDIFAKRITPIIIRITNNPSLVEDFSQDTFLTVIRKIRNGDLNRAESLGAFIASVARNHAIEQMRTGRRAATHELELASHVPDPAPNPFEKLQTAEKLKEIRALLSKINPRYKELLLRYYINEEPKEQICADLGLTSPQFDNLIYRARNSYRELWVKRNDAREKRRRKKSDL